MSVTRDHEDRQKNGCSSRGLGVAAAAIGVGVGVGAALYYFFSKRTENPNSEGSTSDWNCERPQPFINLLSSDDSYSTISEHDTSDTSMDDDTHLEDESFEDSTSDSNYSLSESENSSSSISSSIVDSDFDIDEYDITASSLGIPEERDTSRSTVASLLNAIDMSWISPITPARHSTGMTEEQQMAMIRQELFRERSWTLEDCSICFDVMFRNQDVTRLPCAHNFHTECILPWLQEKHTCPMCRKNAETLE